MSSEVLVIGAGIIGLSSTLRLSEAGYVVTVAARDRECASASAGAVWYPQALEPRATTRAWARATLARLGRWADTPGSGVRWARGKKVFHRPMGSPWWRDEVPFFRMLRAHELPQGCRAGYELSVPVVQMPVHLGFLCASLERAGGRFRWCEFRDLREALRQCRLVVNASGVGARELARDAAVLPIRGELAVVKRESCDFLLDSDHPLGNISVIGHGSHTLVGASVHEGRDDCEPDLGECHSLIARAATHLPELAGASVAESRVGVRPWRPAVRLEEERFDEGTVIHNYGHAGAGVTLSWGCAEAVSKLAEGGAAPRR